MIAVGQTVKFKPEWQDKGDEGITFVVREVNGDRLIVEALLGLPINPTQVVSADMLQ